MVARRASIATFLVLNIPLTAAEILPRRREPLLSVVEWSPPDPHRHLPTPDAELTFHMGFIPVSRDTISLDNPVQDFGRGNACSPPPRSLDLDGRHSDRAA